MALARGRQLNSIGRSREAIAALGQAIAARPQDPRPRCEMALALLNLDARLEALREADAAAALDPQNEHAHRVRSLILARLGRHNEALLAAETAVHLAPQLPQALYTLGSAQLAMKKHGDAARTGALLVATAPAWAPAHVLAGLVALRRKKWKAAEEACRRALRIDPTHHAALNNLGVALQGQRKRKEALEIYQRAAQLNPDDPVAKANIVRLVRPVSGTSLLIDVVRMVLIPWAIPLILIRLMVQFITSARRRSQLRPGARRYYDREWASWGRPLKRVLLALLVFVLGIAATIYAGSRGWTFLSGEIPISVLFLVCLLIGFSPALERLPARLLGWWRTRGAP